MVMPCQNNLAEGGPMLTLLQDKIDTPLGPLWVICDEQFNLRAVEWDQHRDRMEQLLDVHYRREGYQRVDSRNPGNLSRKLSDYFAGDLAIIDTYLPPPAARRFSGKSGRRCAPSPAAR
jgi:methylated-DNA-[protein]-cysteine S-methyltransferase